MIETKRFKKLRSFQDIKLEKAKLRYEMLVAEKHLVKSINQTTTFFTMGAILSRFHRGLDTALNTYYMVTGLFGKRKKKPEKREQIED